MSCSSCNSCKDDGVVQACAVGLNQQRGFIRGGRRLA